MRAGQQVTKELFTDQSFYIGIDCHLKNWTVTILNQQHEHKSYVQDSDPKILSRYLHRNFPGGRFYAVYEAGFSGFGACRQLRASGIECEVIHPADVPTSIKEKLQKTDKVDSRKLARSLRGQELEFIDIPDEALECDRAIMRQRGRIVKDLGRVKNRVKSLLYQFDIRIPERFTESQTRHWSKVYTMWLEELEIAYGPLRMVLDRYKRIGEFYRGELLVHNRQIRALSRSEKYQTDCELLMSIPGVGITGAMTILTELGRMERFASLDKLNNYIGLVPKMHGSGETMQVGKLINRGRKQLKLILIEAAWVSVRKDPSMMAKFTELTKRMNKNKAIIRIARKLLSRIRYILINKEPYRYGVV